MHRLTVRILDVSNELQNKNVPIHEIVCVIPPTYYINCLENSYHNFPFNKDNGPFCLQCMNGIKGTKPSRQQRISLIDVLVTVNKYKKIIIDHSIYIKVLSDGNMSYLTVSTDDVLRTVNSKTSFPEIRRFLNNILILYSKIDMCLSTLVPGFSILLFV